MDPTRERDLNRILALFKPYRVRLTSVLVMIVFGAGLACSSRSCCATCLTRESRKHDTSF